jgi:hypothetical protein
LPHADSETHKHSNLYKASTSAIRFNNIALCWWQHAIAVQPVMLDCKETMADDAVSQRNASHCAALVKLARAYDSNMQHHAAAFCYTQALRSVLPDAEVCSRTPIGLFRALAVKPSSSRHRAYIRLHYLRLLKSDYIPGIVLSTHFLGVFKFAASCCLRDAFNLAVHVEQDHNSPLADRGPAFLVYHIGLQCLQIGSCSKALYCFQKASVVLSDSYLLHLRLAECTVELSCGANRHTNEDSSSSSSNSNSNSNSISNRPQAFIRCLESSQPTEIAQ